MSQTLAAIDVGTNSLHLVVARTTEGDRFEVVAREKEMVRLGSGPAEMTRLAPDAIDRAVVALDRFRRIAESHNAPLRAVATSAVREADNRDAFLDRAREQAGVEVEVVSGVEEARLIHLGVLQGLEVYDRRLLLMDIGGGSTELLLGDESEVLASISLKLGAVRLTERFFPEGGADPAAVEACRQHIRSSLEAFHRQVKVHGFEVAVGCSGTIEQVVRLARGLGKLGPLRTLNGATVTRKQVAAVAEAVITARRDGTTTDLVDLDPKRADIILAGVLVLEGIVGNLGVKELMISEYALREGVFLDTIQRQQGARAPLRDVARRSVLDLMGSCDEDPGHSSHVAHLALQLFDETAARHGLGSAARALLEAGALLANVGLVISHTRHHKHSYYLIRNSDRLVGFTDDEIEVVAQIARYHRKSPPKEGHPEWAALDTADRQVVRVGAAVLRVAIGLDRSHSQSVASVELDDRGEAVTVVARPLSANRDTSLEHYAANDRSGLLAEVLGVPVTVEIGSPL
ncbi:MAG: Ppx/GppA phosphatase family protein [Aquihabitans sp.]